MSSLRDKYELVVGLSTLSFLLKQKFNDSTEYGASQMHRLVQSH